MIWSGVTARAEERLPFSFPEQPGWQSGKLPQPCLFLGFSKRAHTHIAALWAHPSPLEPLKMKRNGATQLTSGPSNPGTSSSPSSSESRSVLHSGIVTRQDITCLRNQLFKVKPKEQTT